MSSILNILIEFQPLLQAILPPLILVWLGYKLGLSKYLQEREDELKILSDNREYEIIISRYLENGVDKALEAVEHALENFRENWSHSLSLLKEFRETQKAAIQIRENSVNKQFIKYDSKAFSLAPAYRIKSIIGDDIYWHVIQLLFAFVGNSYEFFENDLRLCLYTFTKTDRIEASADKIYESYLNEVRRIHVESEKYYNIILELYNLSQTLESGVFNFEKFSNLKNHPDIIEGIQRLKDTFKKELERNEQLSIDALTKNGRNVVE